MCIRDRIYFPHIFGGQYCASAGAQCCLSDFYTPHRNPYARSLSARGIRRFSHKITIILYHCNKSVSSCFFEGFCMEKGEQPRALQLHGIKIPLTPGKGIRGYGIPGTLFYCRGSFARRRRKVSSFTSSMTTAVRGIKKIMPMMPKSFPPIMAAIRVYSGESPTDLPTTRG